MIYESIIISSILAFLQKLKDAYYASTAARILRRFAHWFKRCASGSSIWSFIKRNDFFSRTWKYSGFFRLTDAVLNVPSKFLSRGYYRFEDKISSSSIVKLLKAVAHRFEVLIALFLAVAIVVPHERWNNIYSTAIVFLLAVLYFMKTVVNKYANFNFKAVDFVLFIFILTTILATATSIFPRDSVKFLLFYLTCFLLVLIIVSSVKTTRALGLLVEIMLVGVVLSGLYGIWQAKVVGIPVDPALTDVSLNEGMPGRLFSTMGNPNNYAEILILTLPFFAAVIFNAKTALKKIVFAVLGVPVLVALVLTLSRSAWIAFAISVFVIIFFKNKKLIPLILVLGVACIPILPDMVYRRIATIWNPNDTSASYRIQIYQTVWPMFKDFWTTGVGLGTDVFMRICQGYYLFTTKTPPHTHNLFLQVWIETGLAGFLSFVWFIIRTVKKCMINISSKVDESVNNILIAGIAALAGILVMGLAEYVWFYPRVMLLFWMDIGIILAGLSILAERRELPGKGFEPGRGFENERRN